MITTPLIALACEYTDPTPMMRRAYEIAIAESDDYKNPTGAVIYDSSLGVLATAANYSGLGRGALAYTHPRWCIRKTLRVPSGTGYWLCPGCASPSNHAEARAARILQDRYEHSQNGSILKKAVTNATCYLWGHSYACDSCLRALAAVGVTLLVVSKEFTKKA